jgi:intracellular multiplication protein IcmL
MSTSKTTKKDLGHGNQTSSINELTAKLLVPKLLGFITLLIIALLVSLVANASLGYFVWKKKVATFAMSDSGVVVPLIPLDKPYLNDSRIVSFAEECLRTSFAHDFENYRLSMGTAKQCYTSDGSREFEAAMDPLLMDIKNKNMVMSAALETTVVAKTYKVDGVVHWETQTPLTLSRKGTREQLQPLRFLVTSVIRRVPLDENVRGISARAINLKPI